ncbi:MAG: redoxin domain-containing protein [SAR324 cluster bacterium]|nr:redoxin domain-containing protein [SAR324 cluster bacterium]
MFKKWQFWLVMAGISGMVAMFVFGFMTDPKKVPSPLIGKQAPDFELTSLMESGSKIKLSELKGTPVIVNFWASWCVECRQEAPILERFHKQFGDKVRVLGIAIQDSPDGSIAFARKFGKTYFLGLDESGNISLDYGLYGVPETFFINPEGTIVFKQIGGLTPELLQFKLNEMLKSES